ncbi:hypothetical protein [Histidinibacterium aquaticum]|uniref:Uncharacterized protein n=1 Tax=Histidinibacterium aquaticum TaxID=2613962 RepID=A0A5J5GEY2_9RHOB|nr:hypothetical protein [Histidinibacterium aquaticum]KAA9006651.1 hypothetical protein F3S47_12730 [Histidinibacterium aquaticum]
MTVTMTETPIQKLFAKWKQEQAHAKDPAISDADCEAATARAVAIEKDILRTPSITAADLAAKLVAYSDYGAFAVSDQTTPELWAEARHLLGETS